jgi:hypothetical protein
MNDQFASGQQDAHMRDELLSTMPSPPLETARTPDPNIIELLASLREEMNSMKLESDSLKAELHRLRTLAKTVVKSKSPKIKDPDPYTGENT